MTESIEGQQSGAMTSLRVSHEGYISVDGVGTNEAVPQTRPAFQPSSPPDWRHFVGLVTQALRHGQVSSGEGGVGSAATLIQEQVAGERAPCGPRSLRPFLEPSRVRPPGRLGAVAVDTRMDSPGISLPTHLTHHHIQAKLGATVQGVMAETGGSRAVKAAADPLAQTREMDPFEFLTVMLARSRSLQRGDQRAPLAQADARLERTQEMSRIQSAGVGNEFDEAPVDESRVLTALRQSFLFISGTVAVLSAVPFGLYAGLCVMEPRYFTYLGVCLREAYKHLPTLVNSLI